MMPSCVSRYPQTTKGKVVCWTVEIQHLNLRSISHLLKSRPHFTVSLTEGCPMHTTFGRLAKRSRCRAPCCSLYVVMLHWFEI